MERDRWWLRPDVAFLLFAASFAVFQHVPSFAGGAGDWIDLLTPFAVVAATTLVLVSLRARPWAIALALLAGVLYVDGHGIHLAANSIGNEGVEGSPGEDITHFWDETFGHIEWHVGWMLLVLAIVLAEALAPGPRGWRPRSWPVGVATVLVLGATLFTSTVEGHTWWLMLATAGVLVVWLLLAPRPLLATATGAYLLAAVLVAGWAIWQGGVKEFSEVGWL
jgi:hypothetical protein